jgi:hypothetical protein
VSSFVPSSVIWQFNHSFDSDQLEGIPLFFVSRRIRARSNAGWAFFSLTVTSRDQSDGHTNATWC